MLTELLGRAGSWIVVLSGLTALALWLLGLCHIPRGYVGVVERMWSLRGSVQPGRLIALDGEAGFLPDVLDEGWHFSFYPFLYRVRKMPQVVICPGFEGRVFARDGQSRSEGLDLNGVDFRDARSFLEQGGRRGRQAQVLGEGVYAVNLAQFVVTVASISDRPTDGHRHCASEKCEVSEREISAVRVAEVGLVTA